MLFHANLSKAFWGEAVTTAAYVINRSPTAAINFKTPYEMWTGHKPSLVHLRVFGCLAYTHVKQGKLEPRDKKCLFIGYPTRVKGYKLWNLEEGLPKTIISKDVTFDELTTFKDIKEENQKVREEEPKSVDVEWQGKDQEIDQDTPHNPEIDQSERSEDSPDSENQSNLQRYSATRDW